MWITLYKRAQACSSWFFSFRFEVMMKESIWKSIKKKIPNKIKWAKKWSNCSGKLTIDSIVIIKLMILWNMHEIFAWSARAHKLNYAKNSNTAEPTRWFSSLALNYNRLWVVQLHYTQLHCLTWNNLPLHHSFTAQSNIIIGASAGSVKMYKRTSE